MNKIILIGRLTKDPETKFTPNGMQLTKFGLAVGRRKVKGKDEETDFFNIVAWGKLAEICAQYLEKGKLIYAEGAIEDKSYQDKEGNKKSWWEINLQHMDMLGKGAGGGNGKSNEKSQAADEFDSADMPF